MKTMAGTWAFQTKTWERPGYTALEGSASLDGQTADFFLVVGARHVSVDIQSLRGIADKLLDLVSTMLGKPETGPTVVNIGELMDSLDETPVNATWSLPPSRRELILRELERLLCGGSPGANSSARDLDTRASRTGG